MAKEQMLTGVGDLFGQYTPANLGETVIALPLTSTFNLQGEAEALKAKMFNSRGVLVTGASTTGAEEYTLEVSSEVVNWDTLGFYLNQRPGSDASVEIPLLQTGTVPASPGPYVITDATITASNEDGVYVYVADEHESGPRTKGTPAAGVVEVDGAANTITFHESDAGKVAYYTVPATYTNRETYGGARPNTTDVYGPISLWGVMEPMHAPIYFPNLTYESIPSFDFSGDVTTLNMTFSVNVPAGQDYPYKIWKPI